MTTTRIMDAPAFAVELARHVAPPGVAVDSGITPDISKRLPIAVVSTTSPRTVGNGPHAAGNTFRLNVSVYAGNREKAGQIARAMYGAMVDAWRNGWRGTYGWISRVTEDSIQPMLMPSALIADNVHRFDFTLALVTRH